eukprot:Em0324g4a
MEKMKAWTRKLMGSTDNLAARRDSSQNDGQADSHTTQYGATSLKIRRLVDSRQYQGVINLLRDHTSDYLSHCLSTFPFQALNQGVPDTLPIWETLLAKLHRNEDGYIPSFPYAACDELVFQISYVLEVHKGNPDGNPSTIATCKRVLKKVYMLYGDILERLYVQHAKTEKAIHSLALHLPLGMDHDAVSLLSTIRREVVACLQDYHEAEERLGELTKNEQVSLLDILEQGMEKNVDLPEIAAIPLDLTHSQCFNQIQLQERLYFNQCVRAALQPNRRRDNLVQLMEMLNDRITGDKEVLALYGAVRQRYQQITDDEPVIMWLKKHQHALECTISVLKDIEKDLSINTKRSSVDPFPLPPLLPVPVPSPFSSPTDTQVTLLISDDLHDTPVQSDANSRRVSVASIECDQWKDSEGERQHSLPVIGRLRPRSASPLKPHRTTIPRNSSSHSIDSEEGATSPKEASSSIHDLHSTAKEHTPNLAFTRVQSLNSRPVVAGLKKKLGFGFLPSSLNNLPVTQHSSLKAKKKMFRSGSGGVVNSTKHASEVSGDCTSLQLLQEELDSMNKELREAKEMIQELRKHERELTDRLSEQAQRQLQDSEKFEDILMGASRPTMVVQGYQELYSQGRVEASDAIEDLDLADDPQFILDLLLQTLLFAYSTAQLALCRLHREWKGILGVEGTDNHLAVRQLESAVSLYLRKVCSVFNTEDIVQEVKKKLHTQYAEKGCATITQIFDVGAYLAYIEECVRVSWELCVQSPAMTLNCSEKHFDADFHLRFHSAEMTSSLIKSFIWPTLLQSSGPTCILFKGVVIT